MTPRIRNTRLYALLLRGAQGSARRPAEKQRPPALQLLGGGLDAVICRTRVYETHWLWRLLCPGGRVRKCLGAGDAEEAARDRLNRYHTAALLWSPWTAVERERRELAGTELILRVRTHRPQASGHNIIPFQRDRATK